MALVPRYSHVLCIKVSSKRPYSQSSASTCDFMHAYWYVCAQARLSVRFMVCIHTCWLSIYSHTCAKTHGMQCPSTGARALALTRQSISQGSVVGRLTPEQHKRGVDPILKDLDLKERVHLGDAWRSLLLAQLKEDCQVFHLTTRVESLPLVRPGLYSRNPQQACR